MSDRRLPGGVLFTEPSVAVAQRPRGNSERDQRWKWDSTRDGLIDSDYVRRPNSILLWASASTPTGISTMRPCKSVGTPMSGLCGVRPGISAPTGRRAQFPITRSRRNCEQSVRPDPTYVSGRSPPSRPRCVGSTCHNCGHVDWQPRHPSGVLLSVLWAHLPCRHKRRSQHPWGWTGPLGRRTGDLKEAGGFGAAREVTWNQWSTKSRCPGPPHSGKNRGRKRRLADSRASANCSARGY
jgi:hypothetical protein